ncbi:hypothetical protein CYMTET_43757 [Cymbomonas tetramitiformis]|uniref:Uncharacterized protein n=1 Tax=Cymbomonas tetramitiformis TaxID=36881 RepID=A0AAE0C3K9_9CHLO|nr:hypothetical protein CYMTET_43757 [Cymbomonas tetramitiformis]
MEESAEKTARDSRKSFVKGRNGPASQSDSRFNLEQTKARVFKSFEDTAPSKFRQFYKSALMDRFLHTAILYFVARFQFQALQRRGKSGGTASPPKGDYNKMLEQQQREYETHLQDLAPIYAQIIMQESDYEHTQQDKLFFESLYEVTNQILQEAFAGQKKQSELEEELGRIFRTNQFNMASRRNKKRLNDSTLSIRELYQLKHEGDPALNSRILASLYPKKEANGSICSASASNSPIISKIIPSPREKLHGKEKSRAATPSKSGLGRESSYKGEKGDTSERKHDESRLHSAGTGMEEGGMENMGRSGLQSQAGSVTADMEED